MKRCMLCHWLLQRHRWMLLIPAAIFTLLTPFFAPIWLFVLLQGVLLTLGAMCAIYLRDLPRVYSPDMLRAPSPRDGQAEMVMVDAALLDRGPALLQAAQPLTASPSLTPDTPGHLTAAMALLCDALPQPDAVAIERAIRQQTGTTAEKLHEAYPHVRDGQEEGAQTVTCKDGDQERTFFTGEAEAILNLCASILDGQERLLTAEDRSRLLTLAQEMTASGERLHAFATAVGDEAATFLGMVAVGDAVDAAAVQQLRQLRSLGVTPIIRDDSTRIMDVPVLRRNLGIPDLHARPDIHLCIANPWPDSHTLAIIRHDDRSLDTPIRELREHFARMAFMLSRLSGVMALCLMVCVLLGGPHSALMVTSVLTAAYLSFGSLISARAIRPFEFLLTGAGCLLIRLLINAVAPAAQPFAGTLLCLTVAAFLALTLAVPDRPLTLRDLTPMIITLGCALVLLCLLQLSLLGASLLPALFCLVCGALIGLPFLLTGR
ncbi:MAG: hypothetical protein IJE07_01435 [Clostridia bacterium]|nr:hypothetical protein [Clostridia bacterium]